jgi:hypothetical protein
MRCGWTVRTCKCSIAAANPQCLFDFSGPRSQRVGFVRTAVGTYAGEDLEVAKTFTLFPHP